MNATVSISNLVAHMFIKTHQKKFRKHNHSTIYSCSKQYPLHPSIHPSSHSAPHLSEKLMANQLLMAVFSSILFFSLAFASVTAAEEASYEAAETKKVDIVVEGMVYCQSCGHFGTWSLTGAKPIPSAKVSVLCKDQKDRVSFYKVFSTDGNGYFYAQLEGFKINHYILDHPLHSCTVRLVSSPLTNCNLLSNINSGIDGSPLRYEKKRLYGKNYEAVVYAAGPLAFRPAHCAPMTHY